MLTGGNNINSMDLMNPVVKRRLGAEQAIRLAGFRSFVECAEACERLARAKGKDIKFNKVSIQHFVSCRCNFSMKRLEILAELLGIRDFRLLTEVYTAPIPRGVGKYWEGEYGNKVKDFDASSLIENRVVRGR